MPEFNRAQALRDEIAALNDIRTSLFKRERNLEQTYSEAEIELNAVRKLRSFADAELEQKRRALHHVENPV